MQILIQNQFSLFQVLQILIKCLHPVCLLLMLSNLISMFAINSDLRLRPRRHLVDIKHCNLKLVNRRL